MSRVALIVALLVVVAACGGGAYAVTTVYCDTIGGAATWTPTASHADDTKLVLRADDAIAETGCANLVTLNATLTVFYCDELDGHDVYLPMLETVHFDVRYTQTGMYNLRDMPLLHTVHGNLEIRLNDNMTSYEPLASTLAVIGDTINLQLNPRVCCSTEYGDGEPIFANMPDADSYYYNVDSAYYYAVMCPNAHCDDAATTTGGGSGATTTGGGGATTTGGGGVGTTTGGSGATATDGTGATTTGGGGVGTSATTGGGGGVGTTTGGVGTTTGGTATTMGGTATTTGGVGTTTGGTAAPDGATLSSAAGAAGNDVGALVLVGATLALAALTGACVVVATAVRRRRADDAGSSSSSSVVRWLRDVSPPPSTAGDVMSVEMAALEEAYGTMSPEAQREAARGSDALAWQLQAGMTLPYDDGGGDSDTDDADRVAARAPPPPSGLAVISARAWHAHARRFAANLTGVAIATDTAAIATDTAAIATDTVAPGDGAAAGALAIAAAALAIAALSDDGAAAPYEDRPRQQQHYQSVDAHLALHNYAQYASLADVRRALDAQREPGWLDAARSIVIGSGAAGGGRSGSVIGRGAQSTVHRGRYYHAGAAASSADAGRDVAVKYIAQLSGRRPHGPGADGDAQRRMLTALVDEVRIWRALHHPCIVPFVGVFYEPAPVDRYGLVSAYVAGGNVRDWLRRRRDADDAAATSSARLARYCHDMVCGLQHMHASNVVHRDLAARNVLVDDCGAFVTCMLADFGMSVDLAPQMGAAGGGEVYARLPDAQFAVRWTAPEAMPDNGARYTLASDVWALGVTMWEVYALGATPYEGLTNADVKAVVSAPIDAGAAVKRTAAARRRQRHRVTMHALPVQRLAQPDGCPDGVYEAMLQCWQHDAALRPTVGALRVRLEQLYPALLLVNRTPAAAAAAAPPRAGGGGHGVYAAWLQHDDMSLSPRRTPNANDANDVNDANDDANLYDRVRHPTYAPAPAPPPDANDDAAALYDRVRHPTYAPAPPPP
jgi:serine/threonine protein kinase